MTNIKELDEIVRYIKKMGCKNFTLLKCTTEYPAQAIDSNILSIPFLKKDTIVILVYRSHFRYRACLAISMDNYY